MRRSPLKRTASLKRTGPLRRSSSPKRAAIASLGRSRGGMTRDQRNTLDAMARAVVMVRHGMHVVPKEGKAGFYWAGICPRCFRPRPMQWSHIFPVGKCPHMRWDTRNAIPLCAPCHLYWWHKHPVDAMLWVTELLGLPELEQLRIRARAGKSSASGFELRQIQLGRELAELGVSWPI